MAAKLLAKKALFRISNSLPNHDPPGYVQISSRFCRACFSTSYHAQGSKAVSEPRNVPDSTGSTKNTSTNYEAKDQAQDINDDEDDMSGVTGFVADTAKQGVKKAMDTAEDVSDTVKRAMESAFDVTTKTTQHIKATIVAEADDNVIDTAEYRSIQDAETEKSNLKDMER
ncbi:uncharacterized protein LOC126693943 [Quercus robur]|uniref:uncharacterized protein LOC126693943 n=1 Tax=Quercus robur TaxID=38942 RepID=UPI002162A485|nr:uncharacterized protein LOC126693943 [Quercus robur]